MSSMLRLAVAAPVGAAVAISLFVFMSYMIDKTPRIDEPKPSPDLGILAEIEEPKLAPDNNNAPKKLTAEYPPVPQRDFPKGTTDGVVSIQAEPVKAKLDGAVSVGDRDAQPIVRIPPQYPQRCMATANANEVVTVTFDVSPEGEVKNVHVVDSTNGCLNSEAKRTAAQWKYLPKVVNGEPQWRRGVTTSISFNLEE